jgi:hypothetical protein
VCVCVCVCAQGLAELAEYEELVSRLEQGRISGTDAAMAGRWAALKARTEHVERLQVSMTIRFWHFDLHAKQVFPPRTPPDVQHQAVLPRHLALHLHQQLA